MNKQLVEKIRARINLFATSSSGYERYLADNLRQNLVNVEDEEYLAEALSALLKMQDAILNFQHYWMKASMETGRKGD